MLDRDLSDPEHWREDLVADPFSGRVIFSPAWELGQALTGGSAWRQNYASNSRTRGRPLRLVLENLWKRR